MTLCHGNEVYTEMGSIKGNSSSNCLTFSSTFGKSALGLGDPFHKGLQRHLPPDNNAQAAQQCVTWPDSFRSRLNTYTVSPVVAILRRYCSSRGGIFVPAFWPNSGRKNTILVKIVYGEMNTITNSFICPILTVQCVQYILFVVHSTTTHSNTIKRFQKMAESRFTSSHWLNRKQRGQRGGIFKIIP